MDGKVGELHIVSILPTLLFGNMTMRFSPVGSGAGGVCWGRYWRELRREELGKRRIYSTYFYPSVERQTGLTRSHNEIQDLV